MHFQSKALDLDLDMITGPSKMLNHPVFSPFSHVTSVEDYCPTQRVEEPTSRM